MSVYNMRRLRLYGTALDSPTTKYPPQAREPQSLMSEHPDLVGGTSDLIKVNSEGR